MVAHESAAKLGEEIKKTREEAIGLGMTYDQLAAKKGMPEHSRFVEGGALAATGGWEGLKGFGAGAWGAAVNTANYVSSAFRSDRPYQVEGVGDIAEQAHMDEQEKLTARKNTANNAGAEKGISGLQEESVEMLRRFNAEAAEGEAHSNWIKDFHPTDAQKERWNDLSDTIKRIKADMGLADSDKALATSGMSGRDKQMAEFAEKIGAGPAVKENPFKEKYKKDLKETEDLFEEFQVKHGVGWGQEWHDDEKKRIEGEYKKNTNDLATKQYGESLDRGDAQRLKENVNEPKTAEERYDKEMSKADELHKKRLLDEQVYARAKKQYLEEYYKEAEGLDAKSIRNRLKSGHDKYSEDMKHLQEHGGKIGLSKDEIGKEGEQRLGDERKRLGIDDPLGDFAKDYTERKQAVKDGTMSQKELDTWEQKRESTFGGRSESAVHLNAAMASGSHEAHSVIANASAGHVQAAVNTVVAAIRQLKAAADSGKAISTAQLNVMRERL
jgi:hypothetical protein